MICLLCVYGLITHAGMVSRKISEAAANHAGGLVVIATGPLTNLALAVQQDAQLVANGT